MGRKHRNRKGLRKWGPLLTLSLILVAVYLASRVLRQFSIDDVIASVSRLHPENLGWAALFSAGSYLSLSGFDYLGIRYAGRSLPYPRVLLASFVSLAIGHTVGLAPLSSGAIRYRYYTRWG